MRLGSCRVADAAVLTERVESVLVVTLNRPDVLNAVNVEMATQLGDVFTAAEGDDKVKVVVLRGSGRAFCAGADLASEPPFHKDHPEWGIGGFGRRTVAVPVIAAIRGHAVGGGAELAAACDLIVAARGTRIGLPEVRRGLVATGGGLLRLSRQLPYRIAMELALTGDPIDVAVAAQYGFVNSIVDDADLESTALELAERISANAPLAVRATKWLARRSSLPDDSKLWADNSRVFEAVSGSVDAAEGRTAFLAKRSPVWSGQ